MRRCGRCGIEKPLSEFAWHRRAQGKRQHHCRACQAAYRRGHYERNRQKYIDRAVQRRRELQLERTRRLLEYFEEHPCADCGETDPIVLEFDHLRDKEFSIGGKLVTYTWKAILAEIEKCEVVCANCHRRRTAYRRGSFRARHTGLELQGEDGPEQTKDPANRALRLACSRGTDWGKPVLFMGYPGPPGSHIHFVRYAASGRNACK